MILFLSALVSTFIALPSSASQFSGKETRIRIGQIANSLDTFSLDCGYFPKTLDGLLKDIDSCNNWGPSPYSMNSNLTDEWGRTIEYKVLKDSFQLVSYGADGKEGGTDQDMDLIWP